MQCPAGDPVCRDPPARGQHKGFICGGNLPPCRAAGERSEFNIKPPLGAPLLIFPRGYLLKSFPRVDTSARQRGFEIRVFPLLAAKGYRATPAHMPVIPLATRSQHVDFAYHQVVRPHRSYRPSGGLPRGKPRTHHMWICLQLSGARGVDNGDVKGTIIDASRLHRNVTRQHQT